MKKTMTPAFIALLLLLFFSPLDVCACEESSARDAAYWKKMSDEPRRFLFPLEPLPFSLYAGPSQLNEDGIKALARGDFGEAERNFSGAISMSPDSAPLHHNLALVFYEKLDYARAAEEWKRAESLDSGNPRYLYHLSFAFSSDGRAEEAIPVYQNLLPKVNEQPEIYNELGQLFEFKGDVLQAETQFRRAIALAPGYLRALNNLARLYDRSGRLKEAERVFRKVAQLSSGDVESHISLAGLYSQMGKKNRAVKHYRKAINLRPDYPELHLLLSGVYREMGRIKEAHQEELLAHAVTCKIRSLD